MSEPARSPDSVLEIEVGDDGGAYAIRLAGELDLDNCDTVERALGEAEASGAREILLDVDRLSFIDSSGLQAILRAKRRADTAGHQFRVTRGTGHVADMFRLTAMDMTLPFAGPS